MRAAAGGLGGTLQPEHEELLAALLERLRSEGAPQGVWLVEIEQVRAALQGADDLLRRLADAIVNGLPPLS